MRAAIYARYSSDLQRGTSIDDQIDVARTHADRQGWTVLADHVYSDAGISGTSLDGRPGIQALLQAAETSPSPFEVVLVDDTSRLARDTADAIRVVQQLTFRGVRIVFISQGLDTASAQAETLVAVHGVVDQLYVRELKHKIRRGIKGQLDRGYHTGGRTYGYRSVPVHDPSGRQDSDGPVVIGKRVEVVPEQAGVIRHVYLRYIAGVSIPQIVDRLTVGRVPPPRGTSWTKKHVDRILQNERYLGKQIWGQRSYERRPGTNQMVSRPIPRDQWHVAERPELRIISDELFQQAAERREAQRAYFRIGERQQLARGRSGLYSPRLLVGLTRCGVCGQAISIVASGHGSPRYGCPNSWRNGLTACDNRLTVRQKVVDPLVLDGLKTELLKPELVSFITDAVTEEIAKALNERPDRKKILLRRQKTLRQKIARLVKAVEDGAALPSVTEAMHQREAELRELDEELAALTDAPKVDIKVIPTWVRQQLEDLSGLLLDDEAAALRTKAELQRLNVQFTLFPISDQGRPFLRVEGTGDLDALCGVRNLPGTSRSSRKKSPSPPPPYVSTGGLSLPR